MALAGRGCSLSCFLHNIKWVQRSGSRFRRFLARLSLCATVLQAAFCLQGSGQQGLERGAGGHAFWKAGCHALSTQLIWPTPATSFSEQKGSRVQCWCRGHQTTDELWVTLPGTLCPTASLLCQKPGCIAWEQGSASLTLRSNGARQPDQFARGRRGAARFVLATNQHRCRCF